MSDSILFTAFEPSGDAHAAPIIARLREVDPDLSIYAWGGSKMGAAGATIIEESAGVAAMGLNAIGSIARVRRHVSAIRRWSDRHRVLAHVAVDSPAANFPICRQMRRRGARVVHLVAPQLWAWGRWRVRKLRSRTDLVLCLLPFEAPWFNERGIRARFVGHPRINRALDLEALTARARELPQGGPKIAILPGSRPHEVRANLRLFARVFDELQMRFSGASGVIAATNDEIASIVRRRLPVFPTGLSMITGEADAAIAWADLCLAVSGTISLDIARQRKAMIGVYRTSPLAVVVAKFLLRTPYRLLPNIIADREIVPEFIPYAGGAMPIVRAAQELLGDSKNLAIQETALATVCQAYTNKRPDLESAELIAKIARDQPITD